MSISDVLHHKGSRVMKVAPDETALAAVRKLSEHHIGALVVEDVRMRVVGIFSERDFLHAVAEHGAAALTMKVETLMGAPPAICHPADTVDGVMARMTMAKIRHLPVIDQGKLVGIVSIGDLVKHRLDEKALEADVLLDMSRMRA
jgi:CBS domain-containing protein